MKVLRERKYLFALLALLVVFAGCKGESPTSPTGGTGGPGGVTPPTGANVVLTVSNTNPLVNSTVTVTATVSQNNSAVANGTAVQFTATGGAVFQDTGTSSTIRTTTNGVATAVVTQASAGPTTITAVVNNISRQATVTFQAEPVNPPPVDTTAAITGFSPQFGSPAGGERVVITGRNFVAPVRVLFDLGNGVVKEGLVTNVTATQVEVMTPPVNLGSGQTLAATIRLINKAGAPGEQPVTAGTQFTYRLTQLTPVITTVSPDNGPISGGTRITIFGEGFEAPVQVSFAPGSSGGSASGWLQMQVVSVNYNQIVAITPAARDVNGNGSGPLTGPVDLRVVNVASNTNVVMALAFRYMSKMQITAAGPTEGAFTGGTRVTIDGVGFDDPVAVVIGGVAAIPVRVTGTQIVAVTSAVNITSCADITGLIRVTNINNGDNADGPNFTYRVPKPTIISVSPNPATAGGNTTITVLNAYGIPRLKFGSTTLNIISAVDNGNGTTTYTVQVPNAAPAGPLQLGTTSCGTGINSPSPANFDVTYTSATSGCTDTMQNGITINPVATGALAFNPGTGFPVFTSTFTPAVPDDPATPVNEARPASTTLAGPNTVAMVSSGFGPLTISAITTSGSCAPFTISAPATPLTLQQCAQAPITATYQRPAAAGTGTDQCVITVATSVGNQTLTLIGKTQ